MRPTSSGRSPLRIPAVAAGDRLGGIETHVLEFLRLLEGFDRWSFDAEKDGRVMVLRSSTVEEVRPATVLLNTKEGQRELPNDFVFVMIGGVSPEGFLRKTGIEIVEKTVTA